MSSIISFSAVQIYNGNFFFIPRADTKNPIYSFIEKKKTLNS